jgi:hypothetical protein
VQAARTLQQLHQRLAAREAANPSKPRRPSITFTARGRQTLVQYHADHFAEAPALHAQTCASLRAAATVAA